jgi:oligopeptide transport system ATP-binding protein
MKDGCVVEEGSTDRIFDDPHHDYTKRLMAAALGDNLGAPVAERPGN